MMSGAKKPDWVTLTSPVFPGGTVLCAGNDLNRKFHRASNGVREGNFGIDGLLGFDLHGSNAGIVGTGTIGLLTPNCWE
jgi:hypothetical protein